MWERAKMIDEVESEPVEIMKQCPRFDRCSVPICPLDLLQEDRTRLAEEPMCGLPKNRRLQIGVDAELPRQGLTKREWAAKQRWESQSEDEKRHRVANLRQGSSVYPGVSDIHGQLGATIPPEDNSLDKSTEIQP